jgi:hypothetical protein
MSAFEDMKINGCFAGSIGNLPFSKSVFFELRALVPIQRA